MKLLVSGLAAAGIVAFPFVFSEHDPGAGSNPVLQGRTKASPLSYQLSIPGNENTCMIAKGKTLDGNRAELDMGRDCVSLAPRLAEARYWTEGANGEVIFAAADGRVVAEFYAADGVAYESVRPVSPLMALIAQ